MMIPKDIGVPGAGGNQMSCTLQAFVIYFFGAFSSYYNVTLALCYLLIVRYEYSVELLQKIEPFLLYIPPFIALILTISGLLFGIYNFYSNYAYFINS